MELRDSRRLTGPNVVWERPGAVIDVALDEAELPRVIELWRESAREILDSVGWESEDLAERVFPGGASLALSAPIDALYAATEVNEWAWSAVEARVSGRDALDLDEAGERLRRAIADEGNPALLALRGAARERRVAFLTDDDHASVGLGVGSITWPVHAVPHPEEIDWARVRDVPIALVTGTNGKTTTVRLLAAMVAAAGRVPGVTSTDSIRVGHETLDEGDWSGPGGARAVLRDRRVEVALLETARGGMLRRGLAVDRADVACVTNVAEDHLGEWGVGDLDALAEAKFVVRRAAERLVLNADDAKVRERGRDLSQPTVWFTLDAKNPLVLEHLDRGSDACVYDGEGLLLCAGGTSERLAAVGEVPITLSGAARHNIANALAAMGVAVGMGLSLDAIRAGLCGFENTREANPGRLNRFVLGGVHALVDYAHNPHGVDALLEMAGTLAAERRLVLIGQAGDRDDDSIRQLVHAVWRARPDRVVVKEMVEYLRGRETGEVPKLIATELASLGASSEAVVFADSELEGARDALRWSRPGDLLLLLCQAQRAEVLDLLERLSDSAWRPGEPLP